ncbi:MAG: MAPEG family protein [Gammaproteobacteria bacterium]|jgi:hypothetical protein
MVTNESILLPVFGLALWTVVMLLWTLVTRIPAINAQGGVGGFGHPLDMAKLPVHVRRISDNHNHLYEQPTIFYAVCLAVAVLGHATETLVLLAWAFVAARIVHSLVQALINVVLVRFAVFLVAWAALLGMIVVECQRLL